MNKKDKNNKLQIRNSKLSKISVIEDFSATAEYFSVVQQKSSSYIFYTSSN